MDTQGTLRERHTAKTRQRILDEAFALFIDQGFDATTVDEIAQRADVSARTFFRYFATKEALIFHDFEQRLAQVHDRLAQRPADERPADSLVRVLCDMVDEIDSTPDERRLMLRLFRERPSLLTYQRATIAEHGERLLTSVLAQRAGRPPDDLGLRSMVAAVSVCFDIALRDWIQADTRGPFDRYLQATLHACAATFPAGAEAPDSTAPGA